MNVLGIIFGRGGEGGVVKWDYDTNDLEQIYGKTL